MLLRSDLLDCLFLYPKSQRPTFLEPNKQALFVMLLVGIVSLYDWLPEHKVVLYDKLSMY
jgi:hypothetical protein